MIFLETSFLVGLNVEKDKHHKKATEIMKEIENKEKVISEMTIYETLTVLRKKNQDDKKLKEVYKNLVTSDDITVFEDIIYYKQALENTFINPIGFFDNLSHVVMINNDIEQIISFDPDFDIFEDIKRIH